MSQHLWVKIGDRVHGPFSPKQLRNLASKGKLQTTHLISQDRQRWVPASSVQGLDLSPPALAAKEPSPRPDIEALPDIEAPPDYPFDELFDEELPSLADEVPAGFEKGPVANLSEPTHQPAALQPETQQANSRVWLNSGQALLKRLLDYRILIAAVAAMVMFVIAHTLLDNISADKDAAGSQRRGGMFSLVGAFTALWIVPVFAFSGYSWASRGAHWCFRNLKYIFIASLLAGLFGSPEAGVASSYESYARDQQRGKGRSGDRRRLPVLAALFTSLAAGEASLCCLLLVLMAVAQPTGENGLPGATDPAVESADTVERYWDPVHGFFSVLAPPGAESQAAAESAIELPDHTRFAGLTVPCSQVTFRMGEDSISVTAHESFEDTSTNEWVGAFVEYAGAANPNAAVDSHAATTVDSVPGVEVLLTLGAQRRKVICYHKDDLTHTLTLTCARSEYARLSDIFQEFADTYRGQPANGRWFGCVRIPSGFENRVASAVEAVSISDDAGLVAFAGGARGFVEVWDTRTGKISSAETNNAKRAFAFSSNGQLFATAGAEDKVSLWRLNGQSIDFVKSFQPESIRRGPEHAKVTAISFSPNDALLAVGKAWGEILVYEVATGDLRIQFGPHEGRVEVEQHKTRNGGHWNEITTLLEGHLNSIQAIKWFPDGKRMASCSWTSTHNVFLWDMQQGKVEASLTIKTPGGVGSGDLISIGISPAAGKLVAASSDPPAYTSGLVENLKIWDLQTMEERADIADPYDAVYAVEWSPNGAALAIAGRRSGMQGGGDFVALLDSKTGQRRVELKFHRGLTGYDLERRHIRLRFSGSDRLTMAAVFGAMNREPVLAAHVWNTESGTIHELFVGNNGE